jgi:hypothetical protein
MTKSRNSAHSTKTHQEKTYDDAPSAKVRRGAVTAGRTTYREDYQRDHGPDLDESQDGAESGQESHYFR